MTSKALAASLPESYEDLCTIYFIPRRIKDQTQYDNALEIVDLLTLIPDRTEDQDEFLETVADFMEAFETEMFEDEIPSSVVGVLRFLMEQHGMSAADLSRLLGDDSRSLGGRILSGERALSKSHIAILAEKFSVSTDLFIEKAPTS